MVHLDGEGAGSRVPLVEKDVTPARTRLDPLVVRCDSGPSRIGRENRNAALHPHTRRRRKPRRKRLSHDFDQPVVLTPVTLRAASRG